MRRKTQTSKSTSVFVHVSELVGDRLEIENKLHTQSCVFGLGTPALNFAAKYAETIHGDPHEAEPALRQYNTPLEQQLLFSSSTHRLLNFVPS